MYMTLKYHVVTNGVQLQTVLAWLDLISSVQHTCTYMYMYM